MIEAFSSFLISDTKHNIQNTDEKRGENVTPNIQSQKVCYKCKLEREMWAGDKAHDCKISRERLQTTGKADKDAKTQIF